MADLSLFIPIIKVDATQRLVYGVATAEVEDRAGEVCDYASTKPYYEQWSDEIAQATGGKSLGNLRAMHGPVAAGKVTAITFDDAAKRIEICAKVVDDSEWMKVMEGVYTGFSQGGSYARRWTDDGGLTRYTAVPNEISLVDLPCLPEARFEMIKSDGTHEMRVFEPRRSIAARLDDLVEDLDWLQELSSKDIGDAPELPAALDHICDLSARLKTALRLLAIGREKTPDQERRGSQMDGHAADSAGKAAGRRARPHDAKDNLDYVADRDRVQRLHDTAVELGASCLAGKSMRGGLEKQYDALTETLADVLRRVKNIEQQPLPLPISGGRRAVAKHEDASPELHPEAALDSLLADPDALSVLAIRLAQRNGRAPVR